MVSYFSSVMQFFPGTAIFAFYQLLFSRSIFDGFSACLYVLCNRFRVKRVLLKNLLDKARTATDVYVCIVCYDKEVTELRTMPKGHCDVPGCVPDYVGYAAAHLLYPLPSVHRRAYGTSGGKTEMSECGEARLERRVKWLEACHFGYAKTKDLFVCAKHFVSGKPSSPKDRKSVDWVPTLALSPHPEDGVSCQTSYENQPPRILDDDSSGLSDDDSDADIPGGSQCSEEDLSEKYIQLQEKCLRLEGQCSTLEAKVGSLEDDFHDLDTKYKELEEEVEMLRSMLKDRNINEKFFAGDDKKTRYLTGFPNKKALILMFNDCERFLSDSSQCVLSKFQKFVLTLMRLRLNVEFRFVAYYFCVFEKTAARTFHEVLPIMSVRFDSLIFWPTRERLQETMPLRFRESEFGQKVAVIIDCFDVLVESLSNPVANAQVYSHYKKSERVKFLIGVTPQGSISFLSKGYGGRDSDKFITEDSAFVKNLLPGDVVLADRGFLIHDCVRFLRVEIHMPAFKKRGEDQMDPIDAELSRRISNLRIHVERVIGYLRSHFKVLSSMLPIEFCHGVSGGRPLIDHIVRVCCAITNMYPTVVTEF